MLTLNDYKKMVWDLLPPGLAWTRKPGALDNMVSGIGAELARSEERKEQLYLEMDPRATEEMFEDWEREWGLPDECTPDDITLERRRRTLLAKISSIGDMRPSYYLTLAQKLGYDADLFEWRPFTCGLSQCGSDNMIGSENIRHAWDVILYGTMQEFFECGVNICTDPLGYWVNADELECRIYHASPAQTKVFFLYKEART